MGERIAVWVQRLKGRRILQLQWIDPSTGERQAQSARTADDRKAEAARRDLERQLNRDGPKAAAAAPGAESSTAQDAEDLYRRRRAKWEALPSPEQAEILKRARAENPLFARPSLGPENFEVLSICFRILEAKEAKRTRRKKAP